MEFRTHLVPQLARYGIIGLVPEVDFPKELGPSLVEPLLLAANEVDLVFLYVESIGSSAELALFQTDRMIAGKLRILVPGKYHPLFGDPAGFLQDLYMTHLAALGHVYPADGDETIRAPSAEELVLKLSTRYQQVKALNPRLIK